MRSCGTQFSQLKNLLVVQITPISFERRIYPSEMSTGKLEKCWSYVALGLWVPSASGQVCWECGEPQPGSPSLPFPTHPRDGCGIVHFAWVTMKLSSSWGFSRTLVHANENSSWNPGTIPATGSQVLCHPPAAPRWDWYPAAPERRSNSLYPLVSWVFLIPTHKSTLSLHQERRFLSFHPLQYGPINILVLYFQPRLCNTDHSWLVWISPELPRMLLKAQEEQKCFNQLNQSNKKKGRRDLKIYPTTFATRCDDIFVLFL